MNTLKEVVNKVYTHLQTTDWVKQYPDLEKKSVVADALEAIALNIMPDFVPSNRLSDFAEASEKSYTEATFKHFIHNYSDFLAQVEDNFYKSLLISLVE